MLQTQIQNDLVEQYFEICNQAVELNKDRFPFKQIFEAAKESKRNHIVEVKVVNCDLTFIVQLNQNMIVFDTCVDSQTCACSWIIDDTYLQDVISNPNIYIQNPARLNWEWMYS